MRCKKPLLLIALTAVLLAGAVHAQMATMDEALNVAQNWITLTIYHEGDWGGSTPPR